MRATACVLVSCLVIASAVCGCATLERKPEAPPSAYMVEAVRRSLEHVFADRWVDVELHVEPSCYVPPDMNKVGSRKVEVVALDKLYKRYEATETAPAVVSVSAMEHPRGRIRVEVRHYPLSMKDWHQPAIGEGAYEYIYSYRDGVLTMRSSTETTL